ncbi:MAG: hypothetical protein SGI92_23280 [Bryobacteraceae bacterium]|nr:hypothetical protein [Bryobacteraceae bacterium]
MSVQTLLWKGRGPVVVSTLLFGWMVLNSSTTALADKRRDNWNRKSRFSDGANCRNEARREHRSYQRDNYSQRDNYYQRGGNYQRARDYRQDRYDQRNRSDRGRGYNQYQSYDRNWDDSRYRGYGQERSNGKSALIIAGSTGAGAAVGGLMGGTKGAAIGAIAGGVAGLVYDQHTDRRR